MIDMAKIFFTIGVIFILIGLGTYLVGKFPGAGKLPGDILIKKENFTFYFPLATCLLISLIVSVILHILRKR